MRVFPYNRANFLLSVRMIRALSEKKRWRARQKQTGFALRISHYETVAKCVSPTNVLRNCGSER